jgi:EAL domain-containing protein (putative c-di-GMP-specific phosphodiesterase class I)
MDDLTSHVGGAPVAPPIDIRAPLGARHLGSRDALLHDLHALRQRQVEEGEAFLIVINIADTKAYDDIIRIFGYKFADNILGLRVENLESLTQAISLHQVGFWSIGLIYQPAKLENPENFFNMLVEHLREPIICRGIPIPIRAGIGICDLRKGIGSTEDLLQSTFIAGQTSSMLGTGWTLCNYDLESDHRRAFSLIADLGYALSTSNEFELCFQPRMDLRSGRCVGTEALLRWRHPHLGAVAPNEFIPLAEMTGLMRALTDWVLNHAARQTMEWHRKGMYLSVSVNISVRNLEEPDFVERLTDIIGAYGLTPEFLELELSESRMFLNLETAKSQLTTLRNMGVKIAVDDFGTGPNSFEYLQTIPVSIMKIDHSLIGSMKDSLRNQTVVKSMINMAHDLSMQVVGEGVESRETLSLLAGWGCDCVQGYLLSRPLYAAEFETWYLTTFPII